MLSGDFETMGLADVLQWAEATRSDGLLTIDRSAGSTWVQLADRFAVRVGESPIRPVAVSGAPVDELELEPAALALEHLYDQFLFSEGGFRFEAEKEPPSSGVGLQAFLPELLMEGLRYLDEWPRLSEMYSGDQRKLRLASSEDLPPLSPIHKALVACARRELTLSEARLNLGLSRPALLRRVEELRSLGAINIDGTPEGGDLIAKLVKQAELLLDEKQFDEAAHVFSALLAADPGAQRVKHLLKRAEAEQIEALYREVPPNSVVELRADFDRRRLTDADREVLARVNDRWDVSVLVLASPLRERDTLKSLRKLARLGVVALRRA